MTLRDRLPSDPERVPFETFRDLAEQLHEGCYALRDQTRYWMCNSRWDEAYKLDRMLLFLPDLETAVRLARELHELVQQIALSLEPVVKGPSDIEWERQKAGVP
jgi:PAS domain-containing protein